MLHFITAALVDAGAIGGGERATLGSRGARKYGCDQTGCGGLSVAERPASVIGALNSPHDKRQSLKTKPISRGTESSNPSVGSLVSSKNTRDSAILGKPTKGFCPRFCPEKAQKKPRARQAGDGPSALGRRWPLFPQLELDGYGRRSGKMTAAVNEWLHETVKTDKTIYSHRYSFESFLCSASADPTKPCTPDIERYLMAHNSSIHALYGDWLVPDLKAAIECIPDPLDGGLPHSPQPPNRKDRNYASAQDHAERIRRGSHLRYGRRMAVEIGRCTARHAGLRLVDR